MTPTEEYRLWKFNHAEWAKWIAPRWAEMLAAATQERKRELWDMAEKDLRAEITALSERLKQSAQQGTST